MDHLGGRQTALCSTPASAGRRRIPGADLRVQRNLFATEQSTEEGMPPAPSVSPVWETSQSPVRNVVTGHGVSQEMELRTPGRGMREGARSCSPHGRDPVLGVGVDVHSVSVRASACAVLFLLLPCICFVQRCRASNACRHTLECSTATLGFFGGLPRSG